MDLVLSGSFADRSVQAYVEAVSYRAPDWSGEVASLGQQYKVPGLMVGYRTLMPASMKMGGM